MEKSESFDAFLQRKAQLEMKSGFDPLFVPDFLFDFQKYLVEWIVRQGRGGLFADCGMGKTAMELVFSENVVRQTNRPVLLLTPIAVSHQTVAEGQKFGIDCERSIDGKFSKKIVVTNYERLHYFDWRDFAGVVCDESSILKNFEGATKQAITDFMRKVKYRLLATATAAPNDFMELGTSSEALGFLGYIDMQRMFFKNDKANASNGRYYGKKTEWRFKGHAEKKFWQWVASWARAIRRPSEYGFDDGDFVLPALIEREQFIDIAEPPEGMLFNLPAVGWREQRAEKKRTIYQRCNKVAELVNDTGKPALVWCHYNTEGDYLEKIIPDGVQVSGRDKDEEKEEKFLSFIKGDVRVLITKPSIGALGLNFQHCSHITYFPSHSYEEYYQGIRRSWRFGQKNDVVVDIITTEGEKMIMANVRRKAEQASRMFSSLVAEMTNALQIKRSETYNMRMEIPSWL